MHYPIFEQTSIALKAMDKGRAGFEFFIGDKRGETLYWASDAMAGSAFAFEENNSDYKQGLEGIFDDLLENQ